MEEAIAEEGAIPSNALPKNGGAKIAVRLDLESFHDICCQVQLLREALQSEKRRLGFFLGAGCPLGIYDDTGKESLRHIPDVAGLTIAVGASLSVEPERSLRYGT